MDAKALVVKSVEVRGVCVLEPQGRIDSSSVATMDEAFHRALASGPKPLLVDMGGVEYISSGGLRSFLLTLKESKKREVKMCLCGLAPSVSKVFKLAGFNTIFDIRAGREEAIADLEKTPHAP
ncbi:MAG: STAS domain-containing protein [Methanomassiliicoccales archaeon]